MNVNVPGVRGGSLSISVQTTIPTTLDFLRGYKRRLGSRIDNAALILANNTQRYIKDYIRNYPFAYSSGELANSIMVTSLSGNNQIQYRYRVYTKVRHAAQVDHYAGLPTQRPVQGRFANWISRVNPKMKNFKKLTIGLGLHPNSIYTMTGKKGIRFIEYGAKMIRANARKVMLDSIRNRQQ